jgi:APA family basic amino acid/polyamine antiporter
MLTALVTGNMIGSGVFLLPASLAAFGTIGIVSWGLTAAGALLLALVFARLSILLPKSGGPYTYCREGFGDFVGFQMAYNYWIALWVGNAALAVAFVGYLTVFYPVLAHDHMLSFIVKVGTVWLLTAVNMCGVRNAGFLQMITTVLKLLPLILVTVLGFFYIHPANLAHFNVSGQSNFAALTGAATLTLWSFIGLESATVPAEEADNPKNVSKATIFGTLIAAVIYISSTIAIMGLIPATQLVHSNAPYADAAKLMLGPVGQWLVAVGAAISCFGTLNGWILLQGQVPMAAARDNLFPRSFSRLSKNGTPIVGLIVSSVLITALLALTLNASLVKQFTFIILLATLSCLIPYLFTTMAELVIFMKQPERFNGQRLFKSSTISILAGIYVFWTILGSGMDVVFYGSLLFFSSVPAYVWMLYARKEAR